jgi:hypothetical protein
MGSIIAAIANPIVWLLLIAAVALSWLGGHISGRADMAQEWELQSEQQGRQMAQLLAKKTEIKTEIITKYHDRITVVTEKANEIVREVPVLVSAAERVSPGFVCVADRGALNAPGAPCVLDAQSGGAGADRAAEVIIRNYGRYHKLAEQVIALQEYVSRVCIGDPSVAAGPIGVGGALLSRDDQPPRVAAGPSF